MKPLALTALTLAACAPTAAAPGAGEGGRPAGPTMITDVKGAPGECPLAVRFGSYAMGIDRGAAEKVSALLAADRGVSAITRHRWGMEGEYTLCVQLRAAADAASLAERIRVLLPAKPRGPIEVVLAGGTRLGAPSR